MKRQPTYKMGENTTWLMGELVFKSIKNLYNLTEKKKTIKKMGRGSE